MSYINAEKVLPKWLIDEIRSHTGDGLIYIPPDKSSRREWGSKYNKDSYDGNHACIYPEKITDLGAVLDDITKFYKGFGISASIYHPFVKDYFSNNIEILKAHGYTYTAEDAHRVMLLTAENRINVSKRLDIRVLSGWNKRVATDILIPSGEPWEVDVTKKRAITLLLQKNSGEKDMQASCLAL